MPYLGVRYLEGVGESCGDGIGVGLVILLGEGEVGVY